MSPILAILEDRSLLSTPTVTTLGVSAPAVTYGQTEVFTATVTTSPPSGTTPTGGTVSFMSGTTTLATKSLAAGSATFSTTGLEAGSYVVTAVYSGDAAFGGSRSGDQSGTVITTVAGGNSGNGGPATAASINVPYSVVFGNNGDMFISDSNNNQIREVSGTTGAITTMAGTGTAGYSGDGGPATAAAEEPDGVALDLRPHLFIADTGNNVIRELNLATGVISTVAGRTAHPDTPAMAGRRPPRCWLVRGPWCRLTEISSSPTFQQCDPRGERLHRQDHTRWRATEQSVVAAMAGQRHLPELNVPQGIALDSAGDLFIADSINNLIREVKPPPHRQDFHGGGNWHGRRQRQRGAGDRG